MGSTWNAEETKLAFHLYCQLPFGKLHQRNPEIIALAALIGRTPSAVAMKLCNFASLDPAITGTGRKGLQKASKLDREIWRAFHDDWDALTQECERIRQHLGSDKGLPDQSTENDGADVDYSGEDTPAMRSQRLRQAFFRRAVLSSYRNRCCVSRLDVPPLLVASHIIPWNQDKKNRLNPRNGLCLSALYDKAFDRGLITLDENYRIVLARSLANNRSEAARRFFHSIAGKPIELPERFWPDPTFLEHHRQHIFFDAS